MLLGTGILFTIFNHLRECDSICLIKINVYLRLRWFVNFVRYCLKDLYLLQIMGGNSIASCFLYDNYLLHLHSMHIVFFWSFIDLIYHFTHVLRYQIKDNGSCIGYGFLIVNHICHHLYLQIRKPTCL